MRLNARGDTIVEVLIAMAVVSSVLAGAFSVTHKSAQAVRDSQERGEMLQILQGQVELVRSIILAGGPDASALKSNNPEYFCVNPADRSRVDFASSFNGGLPSLYNDEFDYPAPCKNITNGDMNAPGRYNVAIDYDESNKVFVFNGRYDRIGGSKSGMVLSYRIEL